MASTFDNQEIRQQLIQYCCMDEEVANVILQISSDNEDALRIAVDPSEEECSRVIKMVLEEISDHPVYWGDYKISPDDSCMLSY